MLEVQQSIVNDLYASDAHIERVEEDSPDHQGRLSKEVSTKDEFRGRNLFYYVFCLCKHPIENLFYEWKSVCLRPLGSNKVERLVSN